MSVRRRRAVPHRRAADLESVFYCIAELLLDELPWAGRVVSLRQADQDGESFDVRDWCSHSFNGARARRVACSAASARSTARLRVLVWFR